MKERMLEINPDVKVETHKCFFLPENADDFPFEEYDYIVGCSMIPLLQKSPWS